jgi:hypothetical protein
MVVGFITMQSVLITTNVVSSNLARYNASSFSAGRSWSTGREPPTIGKQLVNFITCDYESSVPFFVIWYSCNIVESGVKHKKLYQIKSFFKKSFNYAKGENRGRISKDINIQWPKKNKNNSTCWCTKHYTEDWTTWTPFKTRGELWSWKLSMYITSLVLNVRGFKIVFYQIHNFYLYWKRRV